MAESIDNKIAYLKLGMLSPDRVLEISCGEVITAETINYRNNHPSSAGLFSERIFGPIKDWECRCGKYKEKYYKGIICDSCGVSVTSSQVRRERFGHVELGCNVVLPQYLYGSPSVLAVVLDIPQNYLEQIVFQNLHINVTDFWTLDNKLKAIDDYASFGKRNERGTDGILAVLKTISVEKELYKINEKLKVTSGYLTQMFKHRKEVLELFEETGNKPEWMITSRLLVLPAGLRPILEYKGKLYASEINDRYRIIIQRSHLLEQLKGKLCPEMVIESQRRLIQIAVDSLFDSKLERENYEIYESLLKRRQRKIQHNVDYSANGMALPDPRIDIEKIGIPFNIATILFKPFIACELIDSGMCHNIKSAFKEIDVCSDAAKEALVRLENTFVVLITSDIGRLASFKVRLINENFFRLNPIVYEMLQLGVSDDAMRIKVFAQLSDESAEEALKKLGIKSQIISAYSEKIQLIPNHYAIKWVSEMSKETDGSGKSFISKGEVYCAYENGNIGINELVDIRCQTKNGFEYKERTTLGRLIINEFLPQNMGIVNRSGFKNKYKIEYNYDIDEIHVVKMCEEIYHLLGSDNYLEFLRRFETVLYRYYNAVDVNYERQYKTTIDDNNIQCFSKELNYIKDRIWSLKLGPGRGEKTAIRIKYNSPCIQDYITDFLLNRRAADNVYDFADIIISEGDIITESFIQELRKRDVESVIIYIDTISESGEYSEYAFGKALDYNPFIVSLLAIKNALMIMPRRYGETFLRIMLAKDNMVRNEVIEELFNEERDGKIGRLMEMIDEEECRGINFSKLKKGEIVEVKSYLLYVLLKKCDISISVRLLCLLNEALIIDEKFNSSDVEVLFSDGGIELNAFGESALKTPIVDLDCKYIRDAFGKINVNIIPEEAHSSKGVKEDYKFKEELLLDEEFEKYDFLEEEEDS